MSTESKVPKILERSDIIILSGDIECHCGRLKDKAHCPSCGRLRLYGMAETVIGKTPNGDVVKGCHVYRCVGCALKFNDIDWYFNCKAPIKIDWKATKEKAAQEFKAKKMNEWMDRIRLGHSFDYNDRTKCKHETGMDLNDLREQMRHMIQAQSKTQSLSIDERIEKRRAQIKVQEQAIIDTPENAEEYRNNIKLLEEAIVKLEALRESEKEKDDNPSDSPLNS